MSTANSSIPVGPATVGRDEIDASQREEILHALVNQLTKDLEIATANNQILSMQNTMLTQSLLTSHDDVGMLNTKIQKLETKLDHINKLAVASRDECDSLSGSMQKILANVNENLVYKNDHKLLGKIQEVHQTTSTIQQQLNDICIYLAPGIERLNGTNAPTLTVARVSSKCTLGREMDYYLQNKDFSLSAFPTVPVAELDLTKTNNVEFEVKEKENDIKTEQHNSVLKDDDEYNLKKYNRILLDGACLLRQHRQCKRLISRKTKRKESWIQAKKIIVTIISNFVMEYRLQKLLYLDIIVVFSKRKGQHFNSSIKEQLDSCIGQECCNLKVHHCATNKEFGEYVLEMNDGDNGFKNLINNTLIITSNIKLIQMLDDTNKNGNHCNIKAMKNAVFYRTFILQSQLKSQLFDIFETNGYTITPDHHYGTTYIIHKESTDHAPFLLIDTVVNEKDLRRLVSDINYLTLPTSVFSTLKQSIVAGVRAAKSSRKKLLVSSTLNKNEIRISMWEYTRKKYFVDWEFGGKL